MNLESKTPVYLLIVDETAEFKTALLYACETARVQNARLAVLYMIEEPAIMPWNSIGRMMHYGNIEEALAIVLSACDTIKAHTGQLPAIYLERGGHFDRIAEIIDHDTTITKLILGGSAHSKSPGPLVTYFTGKGLSKLRVPLTIVPEHIEF